MTPIGLLIVAGLLLVSHSSVHVPDVVWQLGCAIAVLAAILDLHDRFKA